MGNLVILKFMKQVFSRLGPASVLAAICLLSAPLPAQAQHSVIDKIQKAQPSIVSIKAENASYFKSKPQGPVIDPRSGRLVLVRNLTKASYERQGAGIIVHASGVVVTNAHTVDKANRIHVVLHDGTAVPGNTVLIVNDLDLAFIQISSTSPLEAIPIADSDQIRLHDEIITVGNSEFLKQTVSGGEIIGLGTSRSERRQGRTRTDLIQTSINLYEGDSGGPLFDREGHLIGLMTAKEMAADRSSFAVPSNKILIYLEEYLKGTHAQP